MKRIYTFLGVFLCIAISLNAGAQCVVLNVPLDTRIDKSDVIIEGKVISSYSYWNDKRDFIYTSNIIEVYKIFKGTVTAENIEIITQGGEVGDTWINVEPNLDIAVGEIGIFLCNNNKPGNQTDKINSFSPNSLSLAFIRYNLNELSASDIYTKYADIKTNIYEHITIMTGAAFRDLHKFELGSNKPASALKSQVAPVITSFSPATISAGSQSELTINGSGFGATRGSNAVGFKNANNGGSSDVDINDGATTADDLYYTLWSDTQIKILVPHRNSSTGAGYYTGTGKISVNVGGSRAYSPTSLYIKWGRYDAQSIDGSVSSTLANINNTGGYTWQMNTAFAGNTAAAAAFQRAMDTWSCGTKVNWKLGPNTSTSSNADDGINVIRFANSGEMANNILASTATTYRLFCGTGGTRRWYLLGFDMVVNSATILGQYTWQYGPALAANNQYDFETVAVHELGHAMQVGHIIKPKFIMNYSISNGENTRTIHSEVLEGGNSITSSSFAAPSCTGPIPDGGAMIPYTPAPCAAAGINDIQNNSGVQIFPIPADNSINIVLTDPSGESIKVISLFDQLGKEVHLEDFPDSGVATFSINTENLTRGIYFARIATNANVYSGKIIISR